MSSPSPLARPVAPSKPTPWLAPTIRIGGDPTAQLRLRHARLEAQRILRESALERALPVPVEEIARALDVTIVDGELDGADAALVQAGGRARIRVSTRYASPTRRRFTIAHELGHLVLGHATARVTRDHAAGICDAVQEREADVFASEMLMPEASVTRYCDVDSVDLDVVRRIATDFETSLAASAIRFVELTPERCAAVLSQERRVRWAVTSDTFWPRITRGSRLMPWCIADSYFARGTVSSAREAVDATAWVSGDSLRGEAELYEHAVVVPQLRAVLSVLWIPERNALAYR